jgi:hypothetical protein
MRLEPAEPPGRRNRKARGYQGEIRRLREEGYSLAAIGEALADAGVLVSRSTVYREAMHELARAARSQSKPSRLAPAIGDAKPPITALPPHDSRSGQDIARDFVAGRVTNPLLLARGHR